LIHQPCCQFFNFTKTLQITTSWFKLRGLLDFFFGISTRLLDCDVFFDIYHTLEIYPFVIVHFFYKFLPFCVWPPKENFKFCPTILIFFFLKNIDYFMKVNRYAKIHLPGYRTSLCLSLCPWCFFWQISTFLLIR
jgi:hypothetical protein